MDLPRVERELKKRLVYPYIWGRKQSNNCDRLTNFIYTTYSFESLLRKIYHLKREIKNYAMNRWYNYWSAMAVEDIFNSHPNVTANKNRYDKLVDFSINSLPFDHKTTVYPRGYSKPFTYALENKEDLILWLYQNQSQQGRKHLKNRLFIVLYDSNFEHWKMKAEIALLKQNIDEYVKKFSEENLCIFDFGDGKVFSDIIWITR